MSQRFELVSDFQPTGDQPQAIDGLVEGLKQSQRCQVLLGATGTGKSLGYDESVFVVKECGAERATRLAPIGELIDVLMNQYPDLVASDRNGTQILDGQNLSSTYFAQSFDPRTGCVGLHRIQAFTRHKAPVAMYRVQTACGRAATMTGDHNLWVLRAGRLQLIMTAEAQPTDYLPVPEVLMQAGSLTTLDIVAELSDQQLFVDASPAIVEYVDQSGPAGFAAALQVHGLSGYSKASAARYQRRGRGIPVAIFQDVLARTYDLGGHYDPRSARVGGKRSANSLPAQLELTPELLRLIGYYLAEGTAQRGYIIIANRNATVRRDIEAALTKLGIPFGVRSSSDYQVSSTALTQVMHKWCGAKASGKHLPHFWPQLSPADLGQLLRAYFDGDGTVGRASDASITTASAQLASDLAYALLKFGIWARISRKWKRAANSQHTGDWYYCVTISGQFNLRSFEQAIGFSITQKRQKLAQQLNHKPHSNVDIVPISGHDLRWLREQLGLTAQALGEQSQLSRSAIQLIETDQRSPQRTSLLRLLTALAKAARTANPSDEWQAAWNMLHNLCHLRWTPISAVEPIPYDSLYVYDFSVPGAETFLAGTGGFFVHNTYTVAEVIQRTQRPTLVMAHNKTLAAQLYSEFKEFFPQNAVNYFVSYYDYYQPEAYIARTDTYIEKDTAINEELDRLRLAATSSLFARRDVIIVASVSCIYGIGNPQDWGKVMIKLAVGENRRRDLLLRHLVDLQYERNDIAFGRGKFRVRGDTLEVQPAYAETAYRVEFWGDTVERLTEIQPLTGEILAEHAAVDIYPAKQFITSEEKLQRAFALIEEELQARLKYFKDNEMYLEAQRIEQRTRYDLEMLREVGYCSGIENYSRHFDGRSAGEPPWTLVDYFPDDFLLVVDESHMTLPQIRAMHHGDRNRKEELVKYGFRLPSAVDNRPLTFEEFEDRINQVIFTSATPGPYEMEHAQRVVQQIIRPTGLIDPEVEVKPVKGQVDDLIGQIRDRVGRGERVLVTTLTKRMAEDLADYLKEIGIKVQYLHSEVETFERVEILRDLRLGYYDVVVGINLLREGLDLPEVSLVAILDADKEGFLRSETSLIQTIGRAARHVNGKVIMYADKVTNSMQRADRRNESPPQDSDAAQRGTRHCAGHGREGRA